MKVAKTMSTNKTTQKIVARIEELAAKYPKVDLGHLQGLYTEKYGQKINSKDHGYRTLKDFLAAIPSVRLQQCGSQFYVIWQQGKNSRSHDRTIVRRIEDIVKKNSPLDATHLSKLYEEKHWEELNHKKLGRKLKTFLSTIPSLKLKSEDSMMLVVWEGEKKSNDGNHQSTNNGTNSTSTPNTKPIPSTAGMAALIRRIEKVVRDNSPLLASMLQTKYEGTHGHAIEYKKHGFSKLRDLIDLVPSIRQQHKPDSKAMILVWRGEVLTPNPPISPADATKQSQETPGVNLQEVVGMIAARKPPVGNGIPEEEEESLPVSSEVKEEQEKDEVKSYFSINTGSNSGWTDTQGIALGDQQIADAFQEAALLGRIREDVDLQLGSGGSPVYINTHEPFCLATVGVQGAGKSHTIASILESCLISFEREKISKLRNPMTALVLHYDNNTASICEAAGLLTPADPLKEHLEDPNTCCVPSSKATVLVSPTYYKQRKAFYGNHCSVRPLLFRWNSLTADHIKRIMGIGSKDNQLYVASLMTLLRKYQRASVVPAFADFIEQIKEVCSIQGQQGPLTQRIALLESIIAESEVNRDIADESMDISMACASGLNLIIVDLTDPLLCTEEANGLFQVVTEQFRSIPIKGGKLLVLDEAHKFMVGEDTDGLSEAIVNVARLMRHDGVRLAVSTQSPKALAPELLELVSVAVLHQFHSQDWWTYLRRKMPLPDSAWGKILSLRAGNAMVFASRSSFANLGLDDESSRVLPLRIRPRLTADFGSSRTNHGG